MLIILAVVVLVIMVVSAFFITGFGQAGSSLQGVNVTEAECQDICNSLKLDAFTYQTCTGAGGIIESAQGQNYLVTKDCDNVIGSCLVSLRDGSRCEITE
jgi:hypothetical protein